MNLFVIVIGVLVVFLLIQTIRISITKAKGNERLAKNTEIRDASYIKLNDENRDLNDKIKELEKENNNLRAHIQGMSIKESNKDFQIMYNAIEKIKSDPRCCTVFMSFWPIAYEEAKKEYEDSTIGKKVFNFVTLKHLRESNNVITAKNIEVLEEINKR